MPIATAGEIRLDTDREPWVGTFPGLGVVTVAATGTVEVTPHRQSGTDDEDAALRREALRHGWGEPLSWARRGFQILHGGCVTPDPAVGALLLTGDLHEFGRFLPSLGDLGWAFLSDRYTPTQWHHAQPVAHPVAAPLLLSERRAEKSGWTGNPVRKDSDVLAVNVARHSAPVAIRAVVELNRARPEEPLLEPVTGHKRFEIGASLSLGGALYHSTEVAEPGGLMHEHLRLAALPMARVNSAGVLEQLSAEARELADWWVRVTEVDR